MEAEVGGEVDDLHALLAQRRDHRRGGAVRIGDDRGVDLGAVLGDGLLQHQVDPVLRDRAR